MRNILSINGGGIKDFSFLYILLRLSEKYAKDNKEFFNKFSVFSGVSSGSIIASVLALREKILENMEKSDEYEQFKKYWNNDIGSNISVKISKFLIYIYNVNRYNIFNRTFLYRILSLDGYLFSKYQDGKAEFFKKYLDYTLSDIPKNRVLVVKSYNLMDKTMNIFTNTKNINEIPQNFNGNKLTQKVWEFIDYSTATPTFFFTPNSQIDGGTLINDALTCDLLLFGNEQTKILNLNSTLSNESVPFFNGNIGWIIRLIPIWINYPYAIQDEILQYKKGKNIFFQKVNINNYSLDSISQSDLDGLKEIGLKENLTELIKFYNTL